MVWVFYLVTSLNPKAHAAICGTHAMPGQRSGLQWPQNVAQNLCNTCCPLNDTQPHRSAR